MNDPSKPAYRATHVVDSTSYDPVKGTIRTKQTHYVLADGTKSYIELPLDEHTAANVQGALESAAHNHAQIMAVQPGYSTLANPPASDPWTQ